MFELLKNWRGAVEINGTHYDSVQAISSLNISDFETVNIKLLPVNKTSEKRLETRAVQYLITVRQYMTERVTPEFDFMAKWNNNNPMPFRTMVGTVEKETRGMVYMKLHADIYAGKIARCMKCGRVLTNPVSQYFGIGPECGGHNYVHPFNTDEELKEAVSEYKAQLQKVTWEGWIIKSAIIEKEEI